MPDDIKWPQKVTRYRIQCPFQRLLIAKHESQIDWSGHRIESGEALDRYLRQVMLPGLKDCITPDHPKSHYCKSIHLERMLANPAPHINEAKQIRQRNGDEAARQFLLGHINRHKKEHFEGWWCYVMEENPLYAQHPAFQYLVLRPVLESSTAKDTRTPLPVDAEALAHLFDRMNKGRVAPGTKLLSVLSEIMAFGAKAAGDGQRPSFGTDCRWVVVKQQDANAANRVAALSQGSGWCVASSSMAASYLGQSDFHLLVEGGRAKVALRLSGNRAVEVQGHGNRNPGPWWPRILLYCAARGTQITDYRRDAARSQAESIRQELIAAQRTTRRLGELLRAQPAKVHLVAMPEELDEASRLVVQEAWLACVRADPLCGGLLPGWMEADPAMKQATLEAWVALLITDPLSCEHVPGALIADEKIQAALKPGWIELLNRDVTKWTTCPEFLQKDEEVIQARKIGWRTLLNRDVTKWTTCPEFLQLEFRQDGGFIQTFKMGWRTLLKRDVTRWNQCPEMLQQKFIKDGGFIQTFRTTWKELLKRDVTRWNQCPEILQQEFSKDVDFIQTFRTTWKELLKRDVTKWTKCPKFLQKDEEVIQARKTGWVDLLKRDVTKWTTCPDFLQKDKEVILVHKTGWIRLLECDVTRWNQCPGFLQLDEEVIQARKTGWIELLKRDVTKWTTCPDFLQKDKEVIQALKIHWIELLKQNVSLWDRCPEFLQKDEEVIQAHKSGWIKLLKRDVTQWNTCPQFLQKDAEVTQARKMGWMELLKRDATQWKVCPKFLQQEFRHDDDFVQGFKTGWMELLKRDVTKWNACPQFLQKDAEVTQARKMGWMELLKRDATQWKVCPKFLQQEFRHDDDFVQGFKTGWMELLKRDVTQWNTCPQFLQKDAEVRQSHKTSWIKLFKCGVTQWFQCPEFLRDHAEIRRARIEGEIKWARSMSPDQRSLWVQRLVHQKIVPIADLPEDLRILIQDPFSSSSQALPSDPLPAYAAASFKALLQEPRATLSIVQGWKHSPRLELARCAQALAALRELPWNFSTLPADQQSHPLIHEAAVQGWVVFVTRHPHFLDQVPESLRTHPKLQTTLSSLREAEKKALAKQVLEEVTKRPGLSDEAMSELHLPAKDQQMWKQVTALRLKHWKKQVKADALAWERMPQSLQQDEDILKLMREGIGPQIRQHPALWNQLPACYQNDPCLQRVHRFATRA